MHTQPSPATAWKLAPFLIILLIASGLWLFSTPTVLSISSTAHSWLGAMALVLHFGVFCLARLRRRENKWLFRSYLSFILISPYLINLLAYTVLPRIATPQ
ncbi:MAG: hypothetical protein CMO55_11070 [Verrucomicrobiales bacterium]|nr:hypothetical protein [Verrucomicrobiales bacterium]